MNQKNLLREVKTRYKTALTETREHLRTALRLVGPGMTALDYTRASSHAHAAIETIAFADALAQLPEFIAEHTEEAKTPKAPAAKKKPRACSECGLRTVHGDACSRNPNNRKGPR